MKISELEKQLTKEEVTQVRLKTLKDCSVERAVERGMSYIESVLALYEENLMNAYYDKEQIKRSGR